MKTETHYKLALYFCDRWFVSATERQKALFVAGNVVPDVNLFSYLRGFGIAPFKGHDWANARKVIIAATRRIANGKLGFYKLGVLMHYICDAFTYPHNPMFSGGIRQHSIYEKRLHTVVLNGGNRFNFNNNLNCSVSDFILNAHKKYESATASYLTDAKYILFATETVVLEFCNAQGLCSKPFALNELRCTDRYTSRP